MDRVILTADQIYALAYVVKAKYIDYYYISISNRCHDNKLWLSEITKQLVSIGYLTEDFSGEISISNEIEDLIRPLYFSVNESSLDVDVFGDNEYNDVYRFHFLDGTIVMSKKVREGFEITRISLDDIYDIVYNLLPSDYSVASEKVDSVIDEKNVSRIFVLKRTEMSVKNVIATFIESDNVVFEEDNNNVYTISKEDFDKKSFEILTGV